MPATFTIPRAEYILLKKLYIVIPHLLAFVPIKDTGVLLKTRLKSFTMIDCQVKCNKINEKIYKALRGEYENQGVYGDDY